MDKKMNFNQAISFLDRNSPMPIDDDLTEDLMSQYESVFDYFRKNPSPTSIKHFINSFGEYDGWGIYLEVLQYLCQYEPIDVIPHLKISLLSPYNGVRYWSCLLSANFPDNSLVNNLNLCLNDENNSEIRLAAALSMGFIEGINALNLLKERLLKENDEMVITSINDSIRQIV